MAICFSKQTVPVPNARAAVARAETATIAESNVPFEKATDAQQKY